MDMNDESVRALCQAVRVFARGRAGVNLLWHLQSVEVGQKMPESFAPATTKLEMRFVGVDRPGGEEEDTEESLVTAAADRANVLDTRLSQERGRWREDLGKERDRREELERELKDFRDEDSQLIRRLAAKTQAKFGVDQRALFIKFLKWVLLRQEVNMVKMVGARDQFIDGKFMGDITEEIVQLAGELVDEFMTSPGAPVGAILPPNEGDDENGKDL